MASGFPDSPFWDFSLRVYGSDGVAPACLALQDRYHVDVNLLLWCLWVGQSSARRLRPEDLAQARETVSAWHLEIVVALRRVRQRMKDSFRGFDDDSRQSLRARLQKLEIDTEHLEQVALWQVAEDLAPATSQGGRSPEMATAANAVLYLSELGALLDDRDVADLGTILNAALQEPGDDPADLITRAKTQQAAA